MDPVPTRELTDFAAEVLVRSGADREQAATVAEILVWGDAFGRPNQGVWRLPILCARLRAGLFRCPCRPVVETRAPALLAMDGDNGIGHYVGRIAIDRAVAAARTTGVAGIFVRNSNFLGPLGYYCERAAQSGQVGLAMSNSFPKVAPFGGVGPALGTNPMAFAAPREGGASVIVDLSTSASAGSDVTKAAESGAALPEGVATDREGRPVTDASKIDQAVLLPFGGAKGYALAVMVEILGGVATGAGISHGVRSMYRDFQRGGDNGHFFLAIDVGALMPMAHFHQRMELLAKALAGCGGVLPGEARWRHWANTQSAGGVRLDHATVAALTDLARTTGAVTPW